MKPIATLGKPLRSVDIKSRKPYKACVERADVCAVPAAGVVGETVVAFEVARALKEKLGGDSLDEMKVNFYNYKKYLKTGNKKK
jgi:chorismate synthase